MRAFDVKSLGELVHEASRDIAAEVAVIIPLYNYESYIIETLQSVVAQTLEKISIVVVDDCSTDDGARLTVEFLKQNASRFVSTRLVRHRGNKGLSMARNSGIVWSREPLLFMLDADNRLRPPALERLKSALEFEDSAFAYSQLFVFGEETGVGMADIWNLDRLRYGNQIDAMALIRREPLIDVSGYAVLADDHGWEDYDLWCRFYLAGYRGVFVPELLCEYRRHGVSMLNARTNRYAQQLTAEMTLRHPALFAKGRSINSSD